MAGDAGSLTLIGSGEFSPGMAAVYRGLLAHPAPDTAGEQAVFLDTPAGFQPNADEIEKTARDFFRRELGVSLSVASLRHSGIPLEQIQTAKARLAAANLIVAGPGSPTYAVRHWRAAAIGEVLAERLASGAHLVLASSAAIAASRWALPVYEIYKVGDDPYWAEGLDLLGPSGFDLAIVTHWNNREPRCFLGLPRFEALAARLGPETVILGVDENTAVTLDLAARTGTVSGAGGVTVQREPATHVLAAGAMFDLALLTPAGARGLVHVAVAEPERPGPAPAAQRAQTGGAPVVPVAVRAWAAERDVLRAEKKYAEADRLRERIAAVGYAVKDSPAGPLFSRVVYESSAAVPAQLEKAGQVEWTVQLVARDNAGEDMRAARSALQWGGQSLEVIIVDDASGREAVESLADFACADERVRLIFLGQPLGEGAGWNAGLRAARGKYVMLLGAHMEIAGDVFTPLAARLADDTVGAAGSNPLITRDLFTFEPAPTPEADALEFYLFAFRRERLRQVGWLDEKFVFYRNLDLDWSLAFKDKGLRLAGAPGLPLVVHEHPYQRMDPAERDRLSKKNYRRFLDKWRNRTDLLVKSEVRSPKSRA